MSVLSLLRGSLLQETRSEWCCGLGECNDVRTSTTPPSAKTLCLSQFCVGAIIQTGAQNYGMLVAGRTMGGIGVGTLAMGAPLYISEIAPSSSMPVMKPV